ncbi:MAG: hypothetical protein COB83_05520 [Gammaproteobacteria bacterium]|nr:MAG: hypothetical protein COB83_05520 [Gammaproteobacteria bacterium]
MKWEYKTVQFKYQSLFTSRLDSEALQDDLNSLGSNGWELIDLEFNTGALATNVGAIAILKRPK